MSELQRVRNPQGVVVRIKKEQLRSALDKGYKIVNSTMSEPAISNYEAPVKSGMAPPNPTAPGNTMAAEDLIPPVMGAVGATVGTLATLPSGAGVPFGATAGATSFGLAGESMKNAVRAARGKPVPQTIGDSLKESGIEGAKQGSYALAGGGAQWALSKVFTGLPKVLMNKVLDVNKKRLQAEALGQTEEIGAKAASEWKNFGRSSSEMLDRIQSEMPKVGKRISEAIDKAPDIKFDIADFYEEAVRPIINKLEPDPASKASIAKINNLFSSYVNKYGDSISLTQLEKLKVSLYDKISDSAWWKSMDKLPDAVKTTVNLARTARRYISKHVPGISKLNESYGTMASMKAYLAGSEAGSGKSVMRLFLEPGYEKILSGAAVGLQKTGSPFGIPIVEGSKKIAPALASTEINRRRIGLSFPSFENENR